MCDEYLWCFMIVGDSCFYCVLLFFFSVYIICVLEICVDVKCDVNVVIKI